MSEPGSHDAASPGIEILAPFLCAVGLALAGYLGLLHYRLLLGDLGLGAVCQVGGLGDCNSVVASSRGRLLGLPTAFWGMAFYVVAGTLSLGIVLLRREDTGAFVAALVWLAAAGVLFDVWLAFGMWEVRRLCALCVTTWGVNLALLAIALRRRAALAGTPRALRELWPSGRVLLRPSEPGYYREAIKLFLLGVTALGCAFVLGLGALGVRSAVEREKDNLAGLLAYLGKVEPKFVRTTGRPARGPAEPDQTLAVFVDFMCPQCRVGSHYLDIVSAGRRDSLRVVTLHYPVDQECNEQVPQTLHPGACQLAIAAECAHRAGRFQEFHDRVFAGNQPVTAERVADYAARAGLEREAFEACRADPTAAAAVRADIAQAAALGVNVTPTSFIDGRPVVGALKPWMLEAALEAVAAGAPGS